MTALDLADTKAGLWQEFAALDLRDPSGGSNQWKEALPGATALIHCAGYAHRTIETPAEIENFFRINRDGTALLVRACREAGLQRFVYLGTIAACDWTKRVPVSEEAALAPATAYARSKAESEAAVMQSSLDWRAVRLATVFGDGDKANFAKLANALRAGRFLLPGKGTARKSVIPVDLVAELICELALGPEPPHRLVNLALPGAPTLAEIVSAFVRTCQFKSPRCAPLWLLRALAVLGNGLAAVRPGFPLTTDNLRKLTLSTEVDVSRMLRLFPRRAWPDFGTSLAQHCDWYKAAHT